jgi:hypothetical protein
MAAWRLMSSYRCMYTQQPFGAWPRAGISAQYDICRHLASFVGHIMAHYWRGDLTTPVDVKRHIVIRQNVVVDGVSGDDRYPVRRCSVGWPVYRYRGTPMVGMVFPEAVVLRSDRLRSLSLVLCSLVGASTLQPNTVLQQPLFYPGGVNCCATKHHGAFCKYPGCNSSLE